MILFIQQEPLACFRCGIHTCRQLQPLRPEPTQQPPLLPLPHCPRQPIPPPTWLWTPAAPGSPTTAGLTRRRSPGPGSRPQPLVEPAGPHHAPCHTMFCAVVTILSKVPASSCPSPSGRALPPISLKSRLHVALEASLTRLSCLTWPQTPFPPGPGLPCRMLEPG